MVEYKKPRFLIFLAKNGVLKVKMRCKYLIIWVLMFFGCAYLTITFLGINLLKINAILTDKTIPKNPYNKNEISV